MKKIIFKNNFMLKKIKLKKFKIKLCLKKISILKSKAD